MRKIYLAAKYDQRSNVLPIAALLQLYGHVVTSQWLSGTHDGQLKNQQTHYAQIDLDQIDAADTFVLFNFPINAAHQSSGRHVELGYAIALGKEVYVVGDGGCIFYTQADKVFSTVADFLAEFAPGSIL